MTIEEFVIQLAGHCGLDAADVEVTTEEDEENLFIQVNLPEEESGLFIGYHGETLDSIQRVIRLAFQRDIEKRIKLNINQYREQRNEKLVEMAANAAERVMETGEPYSFTYFLPPHERYVIHSTISEDPKYEALESVSEGEGRERKLTIRKK